MITDDVHYVGVNDHKIDLFEGMYRVPNGISYNSYVLLDEKTAVFDTVDADFTEEWMRKLKDILKERAPDYLIVQHMEPDHSAGIRRLAEEYPELRLVASGKAFQMMKNYFGTEYEERRIIVEDGDFLCLGTHTLTFLRATMVHWPEVIMTYDDRNHILFSADAFGKFGTWETKEAWVEEARRYYFGIVGKYGASVQKVLKKAELLDIRKICPLHGPMLSENISFYLEKYDIWSGYRPEEEGILIAYTSVYGNTKHMIQMLEEKLRERGCPQVAVRDLARCDMSEAVAEAFRYSKLVLATTTYNLGIFPFMREFIEWLTERNFSNRFVVFVENGSWMPVAAKLMKEKFEKSKNISYAEYSVRILSSMDEESMAQLELLTEELCREY